MHAAVAHLIPVLAAEKSKTPFFIVGGLLVAWALLLALVIGMRSVSFPSTVGAERAVMAISAVLVLATVSMAVATSGGSSGEAAKASPATTPSSPAVKPQSSTLQQAADPGGQLAYTAKSLSAKAGQVTIEFTNRSPVPHNLTIAQGSKVLGATPTFEGSSKKLGLNLKPGTYTFYCSVPGHRAAGMEGTLTVQ
jgi:plastocyanin